MLDILENLKVILNKVLSEDEAQKLLSELKTANEKGSVAITGDSSESLIITGSQNIVGDNNQVVINQGIDPNELVNIINQLLQEFHSKQFGFQNSIFVNEQNDTLFNSQLTSTDTICVSDFNFVTVDVLGKTINAEKGQAKYLRENLGESINLDMVFISSGTFVMGSNNTKKSNESPPHEVIVNSFFLGKHPITQSQWRAVALLPKVDCKLTPEPSYFKGDSRPVESISCYEANEFCQRLSKYSSREYRLPTEAEWEYACRAGTSTLFNCGEVLTPELANYAGSQSYEKSEKENYIDQPTNVMNFSPNAFGLYDMHGNIREWCSDYWHDNYQGAPLDGSAWLIGGNSLFRVLRGGCYLSRIEDCHSANRYKDLTGNKTYLTGFRVALSWT